MVHYMYCQGFRRITDIYDGHGASIYPRGLLIKAVIRVRRWLLPFLRPNMRVHVEFPGNVFTTATEWSGAEAMDGKFLNIRQALGETAGSRRTRLMIVTVPYTTATPTVTIGMRLEAYFREDDAGVWANAHISVLGTIVGFIGQTGPYACPDAKLGGIELYSPSVHGAAGQDCGKSLRRLLRARVGQTAMQGGDGGCASVTSATAWDRYWLFTDSAVDTSNGGNPTPAPPVFLAHILPGCSSLIRPAWYKRPGKCSRPHREFAKLNEHDELLYDSVVADSDNDVFPGGTGHTHVDLCVICSENVANVQFRPCAHGPLICIGCTRIMQQRADGDGLQFTCPLDRNIVMRTIIMYTAATKLPAPQSAQPQWTVRKHTIRQNLGCASVQCKQED